MLLPDDLKINYYELILTENCNLRCKYCFDDYFEKRENKKNCNDTVMGLSMINDINNFIIETHDIHSNKIEVSFFGGEPTMNWKFIESFVSRAKRDLKKLPISYHINTNLTLINSSKIDFLVNNNFSVVVSLDGKKNSHDANRIKVDGSGSWDETIEFLPEIIAKMRAVGRPVQLLMVVNSNNYNNIYENYEFCTKTLGCHTDILHDYSEKLTPELLDKIKEQHIKIRDDLSLKDPIISTKRINNNEKKNTFCFTPNRVVTISPAGKLFFCHQMVPKMYQMDKGFSEYYGDIFNGYYNLNYYNKFKKRVNFNEFIKVNNECTNCEANYWCAGGCIAGHYWTTKNLDKNNSTLCTITKILTKVYKEDIKNV